MSYTISTGGWFEQLKEIIAYNDNSVVTRKNVLSRILSFWARAVLRFERVSKKFSKKKVFFLKC